MTRARHKVCDLMLLEMSPDVFHGIEFGCVSRQLLDPESASAFAQHLLHRLGAMDRSTIPDDQQLSRQMPKQLAKKCRHLWTADRAFMKTEVEAVQRQPADQGELLPVEGLLNHRGLATGRPSACSVRAGTQAAFVDEDGGPAFAARFF